MRKSWVPESIRSLLIKSQWALSRLSEKVGDAYISNDLVCDIELDDDLEDEFRWLCMRDAAEVLEEGIKNYLETMNNALKKL